MRMADGVAGLIEGCFGMSCGSERAPMNIRSVMKTPGMRPPRKRAPIETFAIVP